MSKHAIGARAAFQVRSFLHRRMPGKAAPGISVLLTTWNRSRALDLALRALAETLPTDHEVLIHDNGSTDDTPDVIARWQKDSRLHVRAFRSSTNIGTSGYASLALHARRTFLVAMDDDVVVLPSHWCEKVEAAFAAFPDLGYLALDVIQDEYTDGAKPLPVHYQPETRDGVTLEFGPCGGWVSVTPRALYFSTDGFPFRPHKKAFLHDAYYRRWVEQAGRRWGVLQGVKAYHACGALWNQVFRPGAASAAAIPTGDASSTLTYPPVGNRVPDIAVIEQYRSALSG